MGAVVLGLDLAASTGWAIGPVGSVPVAGSVTLGGNEAMFDERGARLVRWLNGFLQGHPVDVAVIEMPLVPQVLAEIGAHSTPLLHGHAFAGIAAAVLHLRSVRRIIWADSQSTCEHFTGRKRYSKGFDPIKKRQTTSREEKKAATVNMCRMRGIPVANDDEADAVALWSYGCARLDPRTASWATPLFARRARA